MPRVLVAGLPGELASWLHQRIERLLVRATSSGRATLEALTRGDWSLLLLNHSLSDPPALDVLSYVRGAAGLVHLPVVYCVEPGANSNPSEKFLNTLGVKQLLFLPLDQEELARFVAALLGLSLLPLEVIGDFEQQKIMATVITMWEQVKGSIPHRIAVLERATTALVQGTLDDALRQQAEREAHKLAGLVGTFGFTAGTQVAREVELLFATETSLGQEHALRLSELTVTLRQELARAPSISTRKAA